ncbi:MULTISPECIES: sigma-54-dependent Fis family transcriptional regulator [unclassified Aeromicrobium]|uniref:sigma-54-dependent Fis family transcriptional regulator n=1 Tax=unclassified Aeromicrobium TaxID=2633570 RepID=UPI00396B05E0
MRELTDRDVRRARERVLGVGFAGDLNEDRGVRREIQDSWRRSAMTGISPDVEDIPYLPNLPEDSRLLRAAGPVLQRLADQLAHSTATVLLADSTARIVDRRAGSSALLSKLDHAYVAPGFAYSEESTGTNGIGTALEERKLFVVNGGEHYRESLQSLSCAGTPIVHPVGRRVEGILDITCHAEDANDMMAPLVAGAAREIEQRLFEMASRDERALLEDFLRTSRQGSSAVVSLSSDLVMTNPAAARLIQPSDHTLLWNWACLRLESHEEFIGEVQLADSTEVMAKARRLDDGRRTVGIVMELRPKRGLGHPRPKGATRGTVPRRPPVRSDAATLSGRGHATRLLDQEMDRIALDPGPTLITGDPGVGKRYTARRLHARWAPESEYSELDLSLLEPHEVITALREAAAAMGRGSTVLLRNLTALDDPTMTRVVGLVEKATESRWHLIITGPDDPGAVAGRAHGHLSRRLSVVPLVQRMEEIEDIARAVLASRHDWTPPRLQSATVQALTQQTWPGNVRELESVLLSAASKTSGGDVGLQHLPHRYREGPASRARSTLERAELDTLLKVLEECHGNKSAAADRLGIARSTLYRKVREYGIDTQRFVRFADYGHSVAQS